MNENVIKKDFKNILHRIMNLFAAITLIIATIIALTIPADTRTLIPRTNIVSPVVYGICAILCLVLVVRPEKYFLESIVLLVQSFFTVWMGEEIIGIFLYFLMIVLLLCNNFFKTHSIKKIIAFIILWLVIISGVGVYGRTRVIVAYSVSFLYIICYAYIFFLLKDLLAPLLPQPVLTTRSDMPKQGSIIKLEQFELSERQIQFINDCLQQNLSYKKIAYKNITSVSTVKKEMAHVFKVFGVKSKEQLRQLLLQYTIEENITNY